MCSHLKTCSLSHNSGIEFTCIMTEAEKWMQHVQNWLLQSVPPQYSLCIGLARSVCIKECTDFGPLSYSLTINSVQPHALQPLYSLSTTSVQPQYSLITASVQPQYSLSTASVQPHYSLSTASVQPQYSLSTTSVQPQYNLTTASVHLSTPQ